MTTKDQDIRLALKSFLSSKYNSKKRTKIIEELGISHGYVRADVAMIGNTLKGFEIKSDADNLLRLPEQIIHYNCIFDEVTLVVGKSHIMEALDIIPDWWGIILAKQNNDNEVVLMELREPKCNKELDSLSLAKLLWKDEVLALLENINVGVEGLRSKRRNVLYEMLASSVDLNSLRENVSACLVNRQGWRSAN